MYRAINPYPSSDNSYNDGKWRFILHDMDHAPGWEWWKEPPIEWSKPSSI